MNAEQMAELDRRAAVHAALADPARLLIVDTLSDGDAAPSELATVLDMPSNLVAHHLRVLEAVGLVNRRRSDADRRRSYLRLIHDTLGQLNGRPTRPVHRVLFVCTANSARSHLAAALWRRASDIPAASAGTRPAERIEPGAIAAAERHHLPLRRTRPRHLDQVRQDGDLIVTVCDLAHEELAHTRDAHAAVHWSIPDPVLAGDAASFDHALTDLAARVDRFAPRLTGDS